MQRCEDGKGNAQKTGFLRKLEACAYAEKVGQRSVRRLVEKG